MKTRVSQTGSAHIVIVIILVVALLGALGFILWQNIINPKSATETVQTSTTTETEEVSEEDAVVPDTIDLTLNKEAISIDVSDAKYDDIVAEVDASNGYYKVYSKDLLTRINKSNGNPATSTTGCNATIGVYTYTAKDAVAVNETYKAGEIGDESVYVGFLGPCDPSSDATLSNEMRQFNEYIYGKFSSALK